jgi:hypothetical protein
MKILITYIFLKIIKGVYKFYELNKTLLGGIKGTHTL